MISENAESMTVAFFFGVGVGELRGLVGGMVCFEKRVNKVE